MKPESGFWKLTVYTRNGDSGPGERSRTFTTLRSPDFESGASASSATPGIALHYIMGGVVSHMGDGGKIGVTPEAIRYALWLTH